MRTSLLRLSLCVLALVLGSRAADITILTKVAYKTGETLTDYERERCVLDLYLPTNSAFPSFVWFHGGGLTGARLAVDHLPADHQPGHLGGGGGGLGGREEAQVGSLEEPVAGE